MPHKCGNCLQRISEVNVELACVLVFSQELSSLNPPELAAFQCLQTALCTLSGINRDRLQEAQFNTKEAIALLELVCMFLWGVFLFYFFSSFFTLHGHIVAWKPDPRWTYYSLIHSPSHDEPPLVAYLSKGENGLLFLNVGVFTMSSQHCCSSSPSHLLLYVDSIFK